MLGYVLDIGPEFFLMLVVEGDIHYDGFRAFRIRDVVKLEVLHRYHEFVERALRLRGEKRPRKPRVSLLSLPLLVRSAAKHFPLVTIHRERKDPNACWIGRVLSASKKKMELLKISPDAAWDAEPTKYRLSQVTRVDVGSRYEDALLQVAKADRRDRSRNSRARRRQAAR